MALAGRFHLATVVPGKVIQGGGVLVQLLADSGRAAGVLLPGGALGREDMRLIASRPQTLPPPASSHLALLALLSQAGCPKNVHY